jgi:hypothetical protein
MNKILFLDIDGVLNSRRSCVATGNFPIDLSSKSILHFDWIAINLIKKICKDTKAKIVLSSTWRNICPKEDFIRFFRLPIIDITPRYLSSIRGEEISMWLRENNHKVEKYVIIDDSSDILKSQEPFFVKVNEEEGFSYKNYLDVLKLL